MAVLKLATAASFCGKPFKWARTTTTAVSPSFITLAPHSYSLSLCSPLNSDWRRIARYAHLSYYNPNNQIAILGFPLAFPLFSRNFSNAQKPGGFSASDSLSPGSGIVSDMGSEHNHLNGRNQPPSLQNHDHKQQQEESYSKLLTLPTILTLGRCAAVPLLISTFYVDSWWGRTATTSIFIAAALTDWLDGYLARKMRLGSAFGAFLDPVADKLMVAATLVLLCTRPPEVAIFGQVPWLLTVPSIAIIGREITMSAVREWAASQNTKLLEAVAVNNLGKWKTATQMTALTILLATRDSSLGGPGILTTFGVVLLYISAGLSMWSLVVYTSKIWRVLLK